MAASDKKVHEFVNFNSGEFSPDMSGRIDLQNFTSSTRLVSNFINNATGGLRKFYGTVHIAELPKPEQCLLVPFANNYEPMCLVLMSNTIGLITTDTYTDLELPPINCNNYTNLRWQQINDKLILVAHDMPPTEICFWGLGSDDKYKFTINTCKFWHEPFFPIGWTGNYHGDLEVTGYDGTVTLNIPTGAFDKIVIPLPPAFQNVSKFNILGAGNLMRSGALIGSCIATLYLNDAEAETHTAVATGVISGDTYSVTWRTSGVGPFSYTGYTKDVYVDNLINLVKQVYPNAYLQDNNIVIPKPADWDDDNNSLQLGIEITPSTQP